jgi:RNA polymerase-binding protein DksA
VKKQIKTVLKRTETKKPAAEKATRKTSTAVPVKPGPKAAKPRAAAEPVSPKKKLAANASVDETAAKTRKRKYTRRTAPAPAPVLTPRYQGKQVGHSRKSAAAGEGRGVQKKSVQYSREDLEYFRTIIVEKIQEANEELVSIEERLLDQAVGEFNDDDSTYSLHMADQGTDAMEREKAFLFAQRERKFISHLSDALQRITSGNYGICINCGDLIEKGRLEAVPHARMCVNCKNRSKQPE